MADGPGPPFNPLKGGGLSGLIHLDDGRRRSGPPEWRPGRTSDRAVRREKPLLKRTWRSCGHQGLWPGRVTAVLGALLLAPLPGAGAAPPSPSEEIDTCLSCHGDKTLSLKLPSGETQSLFVDRAVFEKSVHGARHGCTGCHPGFDEMPHPELRARNLQEFRAQFREGCKTCHFDNYTKALDGVHYRLHAQGDERTPLCVDCHGAHDIAPPGQPRTRVSETCGTCHAEVMEVYARSVHGRALLEKNNPDVPVCTDCHRSHDIDNPHSQSFLLRTPELCGNCHGNRALMEKYGLSTDVLKTYLNDFHGMTASLSRPRDGSAEASAERTRPITALCVDCHGVHDIAHTRGAGSRVLKANLLGTCRRCHQSAPANFPAAWLGHYEPSFTRAPLVYAVRVFYKIFIPFVVGGLALQILLHVWRVVVNR